MLTCEKEVTSATSGLPWWLSGKESASNDRDVDSIPGLGRSPGGGNGNPLQYSSLEIPWTEEPAVYGITKGSDTV